MSFYIKDGIPAKRKLTMVAGTGGTTKDGLVVVSGNTVIKATAGFSAATLLGIAHDTVLAGATVDVTLIDNHILTATVNAGSKTSLSNSDLLSVFDITNESGINLDDTSGGSFVYVGGYDSNQGTADFVATEASKFI